MKSPKYKTVYPKKFKAKLNFDFEHLVWVKDKKTKQYLSAEPLSNFDQISVDLYRNEKRYFWVGMCDLYISSGHNNKCPKRILIKYIPA